MQAVTSRAMILESNVERRAKGYGIPVDQYKSRVTDIASEVIEKGQNAIENIQYKAQGATQQAQKKAKESEKTVKDNGEQECFFARCTTDEQLKTRTRKPMRLLVSRARMRSKRARRWLRRARRRSRKRVSNNSYSSMLSYEQSMW